MQFTNVYNKQTNNKPKQNNKNSSVVKNKQTKNYIKQECSLSTLT